MAAGSAPTAPASKVEDTILRASLVSRFSISSPKPALSIATSAALGALLFLVLAFGPAALSPAQAAAAAFGGLLLPALAFAAATYNFYRTTGGTITLGRCLLLAVVDLVVVFSFVLVGGFLPIASGDAWKWSILFAVPFATSVDMIVLSATTDAKTLRALAPSATFPILSLAVFEGLSIFSTRQVTLGILYVGLFASLGILWISIVVAPFWGNFREDGLALLQSVLDAWAGWSARQAPGQPSAGTLAMEAFFTRHGRPQTVAFSALLFRPREGRKLLWFLPDLHPGPYQDLGGSDLPTKAAKALGDVAPVVASFHAPSTHDDNPTSREELSKLFARVEPALQGAPPAGGASRSVKIVERGFSVLAQRIGGNLVLAVSRAPATSDDIDRAVGLEIRGVLERAGFGRVLLIDGHNSVADDLGRTEAHSKEAADLLHACTLAANQVKALEDSPLVFGYASWEPEASDRLEFALGSRGVLVTVVSVAGHRTAWVLIDGNNLKRGLRDEILKAIAPLVDHGEVLTTDNHAVNTTMGAESEVGSRRDNSRLIRSVEGATKLALESLGPGEVTAASGVAEGVHVFGPGLAVKISATINAAVSVMLPAYVAAMGAAMLGAAVLAVAFP